MTTENLRKIADNIPQLGCGGKDIAQYLIDAAKETLQGTSIIDIAPFLGSTTGYLASGLIEAKKDNEIHCIDKWLCDKEYVRKTKRFYDLSKVQDMLPMFLENIQPFEGMGARIFAHKTDLLKFDYAKNRKRKIGLVVEDICSPKQLTDHMLKNLLPFCIPSETKFFFMDFYWYKERPKELHRQYQQDLMDANKKSFEFICKIKHSKTAVYKYLGGEVNFLEGEKYFFDLDGMEQ